jgi:uncharacterized protein DUF2852
MLMWWIADCPTAAVFLVPVVMILFMVLCMFLMARMHRRHAQPGQMSHAGMGCCGVGLGLWSTQAQDSPQGSTAPRPTSTAFEDYRADTLRRLEHEEGEFHQFLDRLRLAKDKSEFDQFMTDRRAQFVAQTGSLPER